MPEHTTQTDESKERAALFCLGALDSTEREEFQSHLEDCASCREQVRHCAVTLGQVAQTFAVRLPAGARDRFLSRLTENNHSLNLPVLLHRDGLLISRSEAMEWQPGPAPGIWAKPLFADARRKYGTTLVRMDKGIRYPRHRHADVEEVYLLSGDLLVEGTEMRSGDYCRSEPQSIHDESVTKEGCLLLVMTSQMDEVLG